MGAAGAADAAIRLLVDKLQGAGGLIIVDHNGACARLFDAGHAQRDGAKRRHAYTDDTGDAA